MGGSGIVQHDAAHGLWGLEQEQLLIPGEALRNGRGSAHRKDRQNSEDLDHSINSENGFELTLKMPSNGLSVSVMTTFDKNKITASSTKHARPKGNE